MSRFFANEGAYDVHQSIPAWMRFSAAPPVWRFYRQQRLAPIAGDSRRLVDYPNNGIGGALATRNPESIGVVVGNLLRENTWVFELSTDVFDVETLHEILSSGCVPIGATETTVREPIESVLDRAKDLGYALPTVRDRPLEELNAESNIFAAARHLMRRRFLSSVKYVASNFIVLDPLRRRKTALVLDQLWLARDEYHPDRVRLLGLEVGSDLAGSAEDRHRDALLAANGFEIFHASNSWARVDPQRVIRHLLHMAAVPVVQQFDPPVPGKTIKDYLCAHCDGPMIRTFSGEGIVNEGLIFVHEQCFNAAANSGLFRRV